MRSTSRARVTAEASSTASQPSSIANAASDAVPMPASSTTGNDTDSRIRAMLCGLRMPRPLPIGEPSGMTAAHPASANRRATIGSSLVYGSTTNPSATSCSAASSNSTGSGRRVRSSPMTSSLTHGVSNASRARRAVSTASRAVRQPAVLGSSRTPHRCSSSTNDPVAEASTRRRATVTSSVPEATIAR
jgi:hypothetical protein